MKVKLLSRAQLLATPWTAAHQAPLSVGFSRQEYWFSGPLTPVQSHVQVTIISPQFHLTAETGLDMFLG